MQNVNTFFSSPRIAHVLIPESHESSLHRPIYFLRSILMLSAHEKIVFANVLILSVFPTENTLRKRDCEITGGAKVP